MQLINQIASNATTGNVLLGLIPASNILSNNRESIQRKLGITNVTPYMFSVTIGAFELALSIFSTVSLVSLPLTSEKKALFWVVSSLIIVSPFYRTIYEKYGNSRQTSLKVKKITHLCFLIIKVWTMFMVSVALGLRHNRSNSNYAFSAFLFTALVLYNRDFFKKSFGVFSE